MLNTIVTESMKTLLLIDDDDIFEFITRELINDHHPETDVVSFRSGLDGLAFLRNLMLSGNPMPDVLFLDIQMPEITGLEVLDQLCCQFPKEVVKNMKVYILTSSLDQSDRDKTASCSLVHGFFHKPLNAEQLMEVIRNTPSMPLV